MKTGRLKRGEAGPTPLRLELQTITLKTSRHRKSMFEPDSETACFELGGVKMGVTMYPRLGAKGFLSLLLSGWSAPSVPWRTPWPKRQGIVGEYHLSFQGDPMESLNTDQSINRSSARGESTSLYFGFLHFRQPCLYCVNSLPETSSLGHVDPLRLEVASKVP